MKHVKLIAATVAALSLLSIYLFSFSGSNSGIPWVHIGEEGVPEPGQTGNNNIIAGTQRSDLLLHYKDGSTDTFSETFHLPSIPLGSVSANNKDIASIEYATFAKLDVPKNSGHTIGNQVYSESTLKVFAGSTQIGTKSCNTFPSTATVGTEYELCRLVIPADSIKIASGTYDIKITSHDDLRVAVDGVDKHMVLDSTPQVKVSNSGVSMTPISVVTYSPAGSITLTNDPIYYYYSCGTVQEPAKQCPQQTSNNWYINVKATGFKANTPISFSYDEHSYFKSAQHSPVYPSTPRVITSDSQGTATDSTKVYSGYSTPESVYYGAYVTMSDGTNSVGPITIGQIY